MGARVWLGDVFLGLGEQHIPIAAGMSVSSWSVGLRRGGGIFLFKQDLVNSPIFCKISGVPQIHAVVSNSPLQ